MTIHEYHMCTMLLLPSNIYNYIISIFVPYIYVHSIVCVYAKVMINSWPIWDLRSQDWRLRPMWHVRIHVLHIFIFLWMYVFYFLARQTSHLTLNTNFINASQNSKIPIVAPERPPAIFDSPIVHAILHSKTNNCDRMPTFKRRNWVSVSSCAMLQQQKKGWVW